jgi:hypothetical protein
LGIYKIVFFGIFQKKGKKATLPNENIAFRVHIDPLRKRTHRYLWGGLAKDMTVERI